MALQEAKMANHRDSHIRSLDPSRDMLKVLDLIELGFQDELDPQGWKMLHQMRQFYQPSRLANLVYNSSDTVGFVWVEDGTIVGNLSLRYALPRTARGRLIGNVVVHPDYRGRGIGRALMETAITAASQGHAQWVGLEVRADNTVACHLYTHLGFHEVGKTEHLLRPKGLPWPAYPKPSSSWRAAKPRDSLHWKHLATLLHNYDQRRVLEIRTDQYQFGGFEQRINSWLTRQKETAWVHEVAPGEVTLAAHTETDRKYRFHNWELLIRPNPQSSEVKELIARALASTRQFPPWPVVTIVPDQPELIHELYQNGFQRHRTLQQMILEL